MECPPRGFVPTQHKNLAPKASSTPQSGAGHCRANDQTRVRRSPSESQRPHSEPDELWSKPHWSAWLPDPLRTSNSAPNVRTRTPCTPTHGPHLHTPRIHAPTYVHTHLQPCTSAYTHTTHLHTHIHIQTHTHTHTHRKHRIKGAGRNRANPGKGRAPSLLLRLFCKLVVTPNKKSENKKRSPSSSAHTQRAGPAAREPATRQESPLPGAWPVGVCVHLAWDTTAPGHPVRHVRLQLTAQSWTAQVCLEASELAGRGRGAAGTAPGALGTCHREP